ncbi:MAG: hypothetical protein R6V52_03595 [Bacteroidales bacterium]
MKHSLVLIIAFSVIAIGLSSCEKDDEPEIIEPGAIPGWAYGIWKWNANETHFTLEVDSETIHLYSGDESILIKSIDETDHDLIQDTAVWIFFAKDLKMSLRTDFNGIHHTARLQIRNAPDWFPEDGLDYSQTTDFVPRSRLDIPEWLIGTWQGESALSSAYDGTQIVLSNGADLLYRVENMTATSLMDDYVIHDANIQQNESGVNEPDGYPYFYFTAHGATAVQYMFEKTSDTTVHFVLRSGTESPSSTQVDAELIRVDSSGSS